MANPSITQTRKLTNPSLKDLLNLHMKEVMLAFNCHAIGTVQSFDPTKQTITATINYKKSYNKADANGIYRTVYVDYPLLLDVPAIVLRGGAARLSLPIQKGDNCLILFNDRDIDNWMQSGQIGPVASSRLHSFSDGVALIGLSSLASPLENYDMEHAALAWGQTMVGVSASKVLIANATRNLNSLLQQLITQVKALSDAAAAITVTPGTFMAGATPVTGVSGSPVNSSDFSTITSDLSNTATQISELLE